MSERVQPASTASVPENAATPFQTARRSTARERADDARDALRRAPTRVFRLRAQFAVTGDETQVRAFAVELDRILGRAYPDGSAQVECGDPGGAALVDLEVRDATFHNGGKGWYAVQPLVEQARTHAGVRIDAAARPSLVIDAL
jgi:hypothetical protein